MCLFCQIVAKEIPAYTVYEDDHVLAFLDITQVTKGHTLIVPKTHIDNIYELTKDISNPLFEAVPKVAKALKKAFNPIGLNLINNNDAPLQSVFHLHLHLIPRYEEDALVVTFNHSPNAISQTQYEETQSQIKAALK